MIPVSDCSNDENRHQIRSISSYQYWYSRNRELGISSAARCGSFLEHVDLSSLGIRGLFPRMIALSGLVLTFLQVVHSNGVSFCFCVTTRVQRAWHFLRSHPLFTTELNVALALTLSAIAPHTLPPQQRGAQKREPNTVPILSPHSLEKSAPPYSCPYHCPLSLSPILHSCPSSPIRPRPNLL